MTVTYDSLAATLDGLYGADFDTANVEFTTFLKGFVSRILAPAQQAAGTLREEDDVDAELTLELGVDIGDQLARQLQFDLFELTQDPLAMAQLNTLAADSQGVGDALAFAWNREPDSDGNPSQFTTATDVQTFIDNQNPYQLFYTGTEVDAVAGS